MIRKMNRKDEKGFTLIELMIVIAIIGILAAIAIPQFAAYRTRAFNAAAVADLKNAATVQEAYFVDNDTYGGDAILTRPNGFVASNGVTVTVTDHSNTFYEMTSVNVNGTITYTLRGPGGSITD